MTIHRYSSIVSPCLLMVYGHPRAMFHSAMLDSLDSSIIHMNKRCLSVTKNSRSTYTIKFTDGTSHEAEVIIGADGIRSAVRESIIETDQRYPVYTGTTAYRGLIKRERLNEAGFKTHLERPICFLGTHKVVLLLHSLSRICLIVVKQ